MEMVGGLIGARLGLGLGLISFEFGFRGGRAINEYGYWLMMMKRYPGYI